MKNAIYFLIAVCITTVQAQTDTTSQSPKEKPLSDSVINVGRWPELTIKQAYLNQKILVKTKGTSELLQKNEHIILFINNIPIDSCEARPNVKNRQDLIFNLNEKTTTETLWNLFYTRGESKRTVTISAGVRGENPLPVVQPNNFTIVFYDTYWLRGALGVIIFLLIGFILLGKYTRLIKHPNKSSDPPYSLARFQLAFWTFLIVSSYIYIWIIKDDYNSLNSTALILLGISAGTALSGTIISNNQERQDSTHALQHKRSAGLIEDLLADESGISIHRFQNLLFTLILGFIFWVQVYKDLEMPVFSDTILTLMGISASTYAALKVNENKDKVSPAPTSQQQQQNQS
ncbi:hypothetical protein [Xanthocytophaga agilis]|uniref:Uncharacterized protein n=1 Tax=Xanthocytophaga agilis TaxID=3048010 RepID=A0AAE3RC08_9BACT|nr:hypothetical protein [Xanthocytophaga agilis]MDJ1505399.1 hypothetical protein [Xanthocytophaga agilis]